MEPLDCTDKQQSILLISFGEYGTIQLGIKKLTARETHYCNALFMDRIDTYCGFSSLNKAVRSIVHYKRLNEPPYVPRVDYTELYRIIEQRYGGNLNV